MLTASRRGHGCHSHNVRISLLTLPSLSSSLSPTPCTPPPSHSLPTALGRVLHNYHLDSEGPFACRLPPTILPPITNPSSHPLSPPEATPDEMGACLLTVIAVLLIYRVHPSVTPPPHKTSSCSKFYLARPDTPLAPHGPTTPPFPRCICLVFWAFDSTTTLIFIFILLVFFRTLHLSLLRCTSGGGSSDDDKTQGTTQDAHAFLGFGVVQRSSVAWSSAMARRTTHLTWFPHETRAASRDTLTGCDLASICANLGLPASGPRLFHTSPLSTLSANRAGTRRCAPRRDQD